ncbi:MAG: efflux RND transporter periplasmic adaptor subunit [Pseudomonadota bacterium]
MNDKSALLGQLKIERTLEPPRSLWPWVLVVTLLAAGAAGWYFWPAAALEVEVVAAQPVSASSGAASVLDATGYVIARRQATVSSKVTGKVMELNIEEGQRVKAGQVLARIDDSNVRAQLSLAEAQLESSRSAMDETRVLLLDAERQRKRARELGEKKLVSQQAIDTAEANYDQAEVRGTSAQRGVTVAEKSVALYRQQIDDAIVRAPFAGVITVKNAQLGEMISPLSAGGAGTRTGIGTLVDMESLEIEVDVNESFINRVQAGQAVEARLNAYPDWKVPAQVIAVIPAADRQKATVKVRIAIQLQDARVLPDMGVRVSFLTEEKKETEVPKGVTIPAESVKDEETGKVVFVLKGEQLERRAISVSGAMGTNVQVIAGLASGDQVVVGDLSKLVDGMKVQLKEPK